RWNIVLLVESKQTDDDYIFSINAIVCCLITMIDRVMMEIVPPSVGVIPVIDGLFRVEFKMHKAGAVTAVRLERPIAARDVEIIVIVVIPRIRVPAPSYDSLVFDWKPVPVPEALKT